MNTKPDHVSSFSGSGTGMVTVPSPQSECSTGTKQADWLFARRFLKAEWSAETTVAPFETAFTRAPFLSYSASPRAWNEFGVHASFLPLAASSHHPFSFLILQRQYFDEMPALPESVSVPPET